MKNKFEGDSYQEPKLVIGEVINVRPESLVIKEHINIIKGIKNKV